MRASKTSTCQSDGAITQYSYDANGNCIQMVDTQGTTIYSYDLLNQLVTVNSPNLNLIEYGYSVAALIIFSLGMQLAAIPILFSRLDKRHKF
jgi:YD repeat-containing protein